VSTPFSRATARRTSIVTFRHVNDETHGGVVTYANGETFRVVSYPRYGDRKSREFRYADVAEVIESAPRVRVSLPAFRVDL
jgi:hypothetical protein